MAVRDTAPSPSRADHTRLMVGNKGAPAFQQDDGRLVNQVGGTTEELTESYVNEDVGGGLINFQKDTLNASTVKIQLQSDDDRPFDITISGIIESQGGGTQVTSWEPGRWQQTTEAKGRFEAIGPTISITVSDPTGQQNLVSGWIGLDHSSSDTTPLYNNSDIDQGRKTAQVTDGTVPLVGQSRPVPDGASVAIKALTSNTSPVDIGDVDAVQSGDGFQLVSGDGIDLGVTDVEDIGMAVQSDGDGVAWIVEV